MKKISLSLCLSLGPLLAAGLGDSSLTLTSEGKSRYTIVIPQEATPSVRDAAGELQRCLREASGSEVPIRPDSEALSGPVISLGENAVARREGITLEGVEDEGFRIAGKGESLFILGNDTREGEWSKRGGTSHGTANGVYSFLEESLGVRWLMPGELGRDIPLQPNVTVDVHDRLFNPRFTWRLLSHIFDYTRGPSRDLTQAWADRQRLGASVRFEYNHNWDWMRQDPKYYKEHPEWFALIDGKRKRPNNHYLKIETTNPEVVRLFADKAIAALKGDPRPNTFSLSPADGRSWSQSPESVALYDPPYEAEGMEATDPEEAERRRQFPGMTSLVLKWYNDVAAILAKEYPEGRLGGYLYGDYLWPATKVPMKLPESFVPVLCGPSYGFLLYGEVYRKRFHDVIDSWVKTEPKEWYYFDLPNQFYRQDLVSADIGFPGGIGIVTPPGLQILETIFPALVKARFNGAYIYGESTWGNSALSNYIVAKMLWNPAGNPRDYYNDWLLRAYGPEAGRAMVAFYDRLEACFAAYGSTKSIGYRLKTDYLKDIYAPNMAELERLYLAAMAKPMTPVQKERLAMVGDNLAILSWRLKNARMLPDATAPAAEDEKVAGLLEKEDAELTRFPGIIPPAKGRHTVSFSMLKAQKVEVGGDYTPAVSMAGLMPTLSHTYLLHTTAKGPVEIEVRNVDHGASIGVFMLLRRGSSEPVASGLLYPGRVIRFDGEPGRDYLLYVPRRGPVTTELLVKGAAAARGRFEAAKQVLRLEPKENASVYVYQHSDQVVATAEGAMLRAGSFSLEALRQRWKNATAMQLGQWEFALETTKGEPPAGVWKPIDVTRHWQEQGFLNYYGPGWYRARFTVEGDAPGGRALLHFKAVDGDAKVLVNGRKVGERALGVKFAGWNESFYFDATGAVRAGENELLVRVEKKSEMHPSGIYGNVTLLYE